MGRCESCQWWFADATTFRGVCHGSPPSVDPLNSKAMWPQTRVDEFCGAHRLAERLAGGKDARVKA
jgi:hypothetical protein